MFLIKKCPFGGVLPERLELTMRVLEPKEARPRGIWGRAEGQDRATARTIAGPSEAHADSWLFCARYDEPQRVSDIPSNDRQSISRSVLCLFVRSSADARRPRFASCLNLHSVGKRPAD
jgi:hypothetical protein